MPSKRAPLGFNILQETRKAGTERSDLARAFHLYMHVHHKRGKGNTPPLIPNDSFEIIMALVRDATMATLLEHKQRFILVNNFCNLGKTPLPLSQFQPSQSVRSAFPSFGPTDRGYQFENMPWSCHFEKGMLSVTFEQEVNRQIKQSPSKKVTWTVRVDMHQVRAWFACVCVLTLLTSNF